MQIHGGGNATLVPDTLICLGTGTAVVASYSIYVCDDSVAGSRAEVIDNRQLLPISAM